MNNKAKDFWQKVQAAAAYITSIGHNIITLIVLHISHTKKLWLWFLTHEGHPRWNPTVPIESPWLLSKKSFFGSNLVSVTIFEIFRVKWSLPWPLTCQGCPKWSPSWALYIIIVGSNIVSLAVPDIVHIKKYDLDFWALRFIQGQIWQWQSKALGSYVWVLPGGPTMYLSPFSSYFESEDFDVDLWPFRVIQGQIWWCQSKAHGHFPIWPLLSLTPYLSSFGHKSPMWPPIQGHSYMCCNRCSMQYWT